MTRVKICGITNIHDARKVADLGADALGFHIELNGARAPISDEAAGKIIRQLPGSVAGVMVTSISDPDRLIPLAKSTGAKILQLYGDITPDQIRAVKAALPAIGIWKVIKVGDDSLSEAKKYEGTADAIVLDTAHRNSGQLGGTGKTHDWNVSRSIVESISTPIILAGGLNPENITDALLQVQPQGVDVNSGVTNADGTKNLEKVRSFIQSAKAQ